MGSDLQPACLEYFKTNFHMTIQLESFLACSHPSVLAPKQGANCYILSSLLELKKKNFKIFKLNKK